MNLSAIDLLLLSQAAQWGLLIIHLLRCRDVRLDIEKIKLHVRMRDPGERQE